MRPGYRARQFWQALTAAPGADAPLALAPELLELYRHMPRADRAHGLRTYRLLAAGGYPEELLIAGLLHDVGKSRSGIHLWDRVLFVLADRLAPGWLGALSREQRTARLAVGLVALRDHAEVGAALVTAAGGSPNTARLIRYHHANTTSLAWPSADLALLKALQAADEQC